MNKSMMLVIFLFSSFTLYAENIAEQGIMNRLLIHLEQEKVNARTCLDIEVTVGSDENKYNLYDVTEIHNEICGGDPETFPRYGLYRGNISTGKLYKLDFISGEYDQI
jgi:hypothetical protein